MAGMGSKATLEGSAIGLCPVEPLSGKACS